MDDQLPPQGSPPSFPPPPLTPPPIILPPVPPRRGGRIWRIIAIIALALLALSVLSNFKNVGRSSRGRSTSHGIDHQLEEVMVERHVTEDKIAVIKVEGIISSADMERHGMNMVEFIKEQLKIADRDPDVKAVVLKVNSPGGEVLASDEINGAISDFQKESGKPVVASMGSLAASGGYYVSVPCDWIVANELTITGSIGVIMHGYNYRGLMNKIGIRPDVYKSGKFKDMLSGDKETDPEKLSPEQKNELAEERAMVQDLINETFDRFKKVVEDGRADAKSKNSKARALTKNWRDYADGRVFSGKQALKLGFVDELGDFEVAVDRAKTLAKISRANLIEYRQPFDLGLLFRLLGKTEAPALKIELGGDAPKLQAGQLYFIMPTVLR